ncbi:hypothetical protein DAEQUDRAFT_109300 [Daedalea quercina L-15889]|uniref:MYND-type domain-containing protein n=1 Tax=Daedalea quercina L-15889 TaxID=1314783 RepID=A0A165S4B3_9APHY|nr:hypothetical protein DAEQUDRAFT_109300 [Daedalea quercina L-15889]
MTAHCAKCPKRAVKRCKACGVSSASYCSQDRQELDWPDHKYECDSKAHSQLDSADQLVRAVYRRSLPPDMGTLGDWGFVRAAMVGKIFELFEFWVDFIVYLEIPSRSLRNWRRDNVLPRIIRLGYQKLGRANKGKAFKWFQENSWIIDPSVGGVPRNFGHEQQAGAARFRQWVGFPDAVFRDIEAAKSTWPKTKTVCYDFYQNLLNHFALLPPTTLWMDFGFCVCRSCREEKKLEDIYKRVFQLHTFDEFWTARDNGSLMSLIELLLSTYEWRRRAELSDILQTPPSTNQTKPVWVLKGFLLCDYDGVIRNAPYEPVFAEYGFPNARGRADTVELRRLYRRLLFDANVRPLVLQEAATEENLYNFADSILGVGKEERELFSFLLRRNIAESGQ